MSEIQKLLEAKIENPTDLLAKINQDYSYITKEYVLKADLNQIKELQSVKEIINNSRDGLIAKIDMFIDLVEAEVKPVMEPLNLAKKKLKDILLNIKELDIIEKKLIIDDNYKDCFNLIISEIKDCGLNLVKMKTLNYFYDLEKKAKTINIEDMAKSFIKKYLEETEVVKQQAPAYIEDYQTDYNLQRVLLKKMEVDKMKEKEEVLMSTPAPTPTPVIEEKPIVVEPQKVEVVEKQIIYKTATIEITYNEEQAKLLNDFIKVLELNNIKFNIIK